jgi:hypothetical protein
MSVIETIVDDDQTVLLNIKSLARGIFIAGSIASCLDAITTWYVVSNIGIQVEGNSWMASAMRHFGVANVCIARALIGILIFWLIANIVVGRRFRIKLHFLEVLKDFLSRTLFLKKLSSKSPKIQGLQPIKNYFKRNRVAYEVIPGLVITWAVVGNNIRAVVTLILSLR